MLARVQLALAAALAIVAVVLIAVLVLDDGDATIRAPNADAAVVGPTGWVGAERPPIPVKDFALKDQDGEPLSLAKFRGRPVVLTFLYTTCEDTCPITADQIRGALDELGEDIPAVAVSVDPQNDTERRAKRFLLDRRMTGRMDFALGTEQELRPVWDAYGVQPQGEDFEHSASVVLIDATGRQRIGFGLDHLTSSGLVHDLRRLMREPS